jgi:hypothetical protein
MRSILRVLLLGGACLLCGGVLIQTPQRAAAQKKEDQPRQAGKNFEIRIIRMGESYQAIRFKPATGESWLANGDKWEKIPEAAAVPAGDYEVLLVATDQDFAALRYDRNTGTTWRLKGRKWVKMEEPE